MVYSRSLLRAIISAAYFRRSRKSRSSHCGWYNCTEVRQCLNYTPRSELSFTRARHTNSSVLPPTTAITEPEASHWHTAIMCSLPQPSTTCRNYNAYLSFFETEQPSLVEDFNAPAAAQVVCQVGVRARYRVKHLPRFIPDSIIFPHILIEKFIIATWAEDTRHKVFVCQICRNVALSLVVVSKHFDILRKKLM